MHTSYFHPEGRTGVVLLPSETEVVQASKFSHCSLVEAINVEEGDAAFASWDGLLYSADGTTLLRVPAGATEITIREGCTTIAAGAMEGCAKLETINAPSTVTSISPNVFESVPTVSLPASVILGDDVEDSTDVNLSEGDVVTGVEESSKSETAQTPSQLTAMVALTAIGNGLCEVDPSNIAIVLPASAQPELWVAAGFDASSHEEDADIATAQTYGAAVSYPVLTIGNFTKYDLFLAKTQGDTTNHLPTIKNPATPCSTGIPRGSYFNETILQSNADGSSTNADMRLGYNTDYGIWTTWYRSEDPAKTLHFMLYTFSTVKGTAGLPATKFIDANGNDIVQGWTMLSATSNRTWYIAEIGGTSLSYNVVWHGNGGSWGSDADRTVLRKPLPATTEAGPVGPNGKVELPTRPNHQFLGWTSNPKDTFCASSVRVSATECEWYAQWKRVDYNVSFDVDSEPNDDNYPGDEKPDETINIDDGQVVVEDPQRPGYVFQGWVIPDAETGNKDSLDQDLVYQGDDGKWYVDASKLHDYANSDGKVELTARWTSVISVDVPSAVTFYADVVTQGNESREGAASSAFGQSKVANQSQVDLRVVGLESEAVETTDVTLGADSILKKAAAATPATSASKLLSLYPSAKAWTAEELQNPDAVGGTKATTAVDFDLDDLLLEASFVADDFTIPAGDTLNMGYRLNLTETGQELDYDKLSTLEDGQSAAIANVSYCFAADLPSVFWTIDDDGRTRNLSAIKADAGKIAAGDAETIAKYTRWMEEDHRFYVKWYDQGKTQAQDPDAATVYEVRILGLNHDDKADSSGKAGIAFQLINSLKDRYRMNATNIVTGVWERSELRARMNPGTQSVASGTDDNAIWNQVPSLLAGAIKPVRKVCWSGANQTSSATLTVNDSLFLPAEVEIRKIATYTNYVSSYYDRTLIYEGSLYPSFSDAPNDYVAWSGSAKRLGDAGDYESHWLRSHSSNPNNLSYTFMCVGPDGSTSHAGAATEVYGVSPAFCL